MKVPIYISSFASISALGKNQEEVWQSYLQGKPGFTVKTFEETPTYVAALRNASSQEIEEIRKANPKYEALDKSVLMAIYSARKAMEPIDWKETGFGVNIGSSRGATELVEKYHAEYISTGKTSTLASPTTTLGNISSWVSQDLGSKGPQISHSITCSTALHALLNGIAWIQAGMCNNFIIGGSEAPLTPFTIAQMNALKLYARFDENEKYPNKSMDLSKPFNTMILGEAAAAFCLGKEPSNAIAEITGVGYGSEKLKHNISISTNADCLKASMKMALTQANLDTVDAIVLHAPGTKKGDSSEVNAIHQVFGKTPMLTSNKFMIGHTFGASGAMSMEMALLMLVHQKFIENPFYQNNNKKDKLKTIMVNAVGFGGNAVSIIISK